MIARLYQRLLDALIPLSVIRQSQQFGWDAEWLANVEADHDAWMPDELWASHHRCAAGPLPSERVPPRMAGGSTTDLPPVVRAADAEPAQVFSVGGPLKSDEQVIEELVADYREFVRACFRHRP